MRLINEGYERVVKIARERSLGRSVRYRLSGFCVVREEDDCRLLRNTLTGQVYTFDEREWDTISGLRSMTTSYDALEREGLLALAEERSIVEEDYDECGEYVFLRNVLLSMRKPADGYVSYVIFPTTGCNARCTYCFENDFVVATMTEETALATVDYIERTRGDGPIRLKWFGGEPLVAVPRIDFICRTLEERGVEFTSSITTNASLVTPGLADRMRDLWRLKKAQVSLDGDRAAYEERKRYLNPRLHNYDAAMRGIRLLAERGVKIQLRCNYDAHNLDGLTAFVEDMHRELGDLPNVRLYFAQLFQVRREAVAPNLMHAVQEVEDLVDSFGLLGERKRNKSSFPLNYCMADSMDRCAVIEPGGQLQNCEHLFDENRFGDVWDGVTNRARFDELKRSYEVEDCCRTCPFLPECTPFRRLGCPDAQSDYCRETAMAAAQNHLHRVARRLREKSQA